MESFKSMMIKDAFSDTVMVMTSVLFKNAFHHSCHGRRTYKITSVYKPVSVFCLLLSLFVVVLLQKRSLKRTL